MAASAPSPRTWVFGPASDLLLGCGVGYVLLAGFMGVLPTDPETLLAWGVILTLVTGAPHYGATLLRVYENPQDRRKYTFFGVWASLAVWGFFVLSVYQPIVASIFLTVYVTWSPWHYTGQNYGLSLMFLRRREVPFGAGTKRWIYASFVLSYVMTFLALHSGRAEGGYIPIQFGGSIYALTTLQLPYFSYEYLVPAAIVGYGLCTAVAVAQLWRRSSLRDLAPVLAMLATQALWFVVAIVAARYSGVQIQVEYVVFYFVWVGIAHSVQYLWITTYYAARTEPPWGRVVYYLKTLLAGSLVFVVPGVIFAPAVLGVVPYQTGLWVLVASAVNLQHFILDGAIWKLRDGPVARILLAQPEPETVAPIDAGRGRPWLRTTFWVVGSAAVVFNVAGQWAYEMVWKPAARSGDLASTEAAERVLRWLGRDSPSFAASRAQAARAAGDLAGAAAFFDESLTIFPTAEAWNGLAAVQLERGEPLLAESSYRRSLELRPTGEAWTVLGRMHEQRGESEQAIAAYYAALRVEPKYVPALVEAGRYWSERGRPRRARRFLEAAQRLALE